MSGRFLFSMLLTLVASPDAQTAVPGPPGTDSTSRPALSGRPGDTARLRGDSVATKAVRDTAWLPDWTLRLGGSVGVQFPSFAQRSRFRADIATVVARDTLTLHQPLQSSELAPILGVELSLQWKRTLRLVAEGQWSAFWNDARAGRDSLVRDWNVTTRTWRAGVGPDFMVSPKVFSIHGMGPLVIEVRGWLLRSELESRGTSAGWGSGWSAGLASSMVSSRHFEMGGRIRWHQESVTGDGTWADLLETSSSTLAPRWNTGGLALGLWSTFDLGW